MSTPRRLRGVTALLTAACATAVLALPASGDGHIPMSGKADCAEDAASLEFARTMLEGQGLSSEMIDEAMAFACSMGAFGDAGGGITLEQMLGGEEQDAGGGLTLEAIPDILEAQGLAPEEAEQIVAMYEQMGLVGADGELMTEGLPLDFLEQLLVGYAGGGVTAIPDSSDETSAVINHEEQYDPDVLKELALADPAGTVEAAIVAAAAQRGIDPATLRQMTLEDILGVLAEE